MEWRNRVIAGSRLGATTLPGWAAASYQALRKEVSNDAYPCFFGVQAENRGEMFYAFVSKGDEASLSEVMTTFASLARQPAHDKNNLAVFFEPDPQPLLHEEYQDLFWQTLQSLHDADTHPEADHQSDPANPQWEFTYQGLEMFVVCACPSFERRRSRNLGPGMVLLFQPRSVFVDKITNKVIGLRARLEVRKRLQRWDELEAHPDLGFYGDPGNLEWKQYFLPDHNRRYEGGCPFSSRGSKARKFSLTPAQEALWFLWRMEPRSAAHNVSASLDLQGSFDVGLLRRALDMVIERHPMLRTRFADDGGVLQARVMESASEAVDWDEHDLRSHAAPMAWAEALFRARGIRSFDLANGRPLRATLLRLDSGRGLLQVCTHEIVVDDWSFNHLLKDLLETYAALCSGRPPEPLPPGFGEHALLAGVRSDVATTTRQLAYWRERLAGLPAALELPLDRPHAARRPLSGKQLNRPLAPDLYAGVRHLAASLHTTPFVVMLGAFALLLQRYSGQRDVRIAVPLLRRDSNRADEAIGQFTNTAVVRLQVSSTEPFATLAEQAGRYLAEAQENGDVPFAQVVRSLRVDRSLAHTPLSQVLFGPAPAFRPARNDAIEARLLDDGLGRAHYDLSLRVAVDRDSATLYLNHSSAFCTDTARLLLSHYVGLLERLMLPHAAESSPLASFELSRVVDAAAVAA